MVEIRLHVLLYSGPSLIRTPNIRLLGLSELRIHFLINAVVLQVYAKMASSSCSASCSRKRKRTVVSLETKLAILDRLKKGEIQAQLASEYGVGKSTVANIKKNEEKIRNFATTMDSLAMSKKRKVMRLADDDKLDQALFLWFVQKRSQNLPVSGPVLCEKAAIMHAQIHAGESVPPFQGSRGWLWRFCNRHGVRQLSLQGEKLSSDTTAVDTLYTKIFPS